MPEFMRAMGEVAVIRVLASSFHEIFAQFGFIPLAFGGFLGMGKLAIATLLAIVGEVEFAGDVFVLLLTEEVLYLADMADRYFLGWGLVGQDGVQDILNSTHISLFNYMLL